MCRKATFLIAGALALGVLRAQPVSGPDTTDWRKIGNTAVDLALASPASGPVDDVWFAPDGSRLYARTRTGVVFETVDFEKWSLAAALAGSPDADTAEAERLPSPGARVVAPAASRGRVYALGNHLYRSDDGGQTWTDLTGYRDASVIGPGQRSLAVSPNDPDQLTVANDYGVWRSLDGGLSWSGLNQELPNLPVARILATPQGPAGARILVAGVGAAEWQPGNGQAWEPVTEASLAAEARTRALASNALGANITAFAATADTMYAGASDGRIWVSFDGGSTWRETPNTPARGRVENIYVDPAEPRTALAALAGTGAHLLRTTNSGTFWDDLSAGLPAVPAHAVAADRSSGAVYVATDEGVFYALVDLQNANPAPPSWISLTRNLPRAAATDVKLDANGYQLYVALSGYGVYATTAPHRARALRLVNTADFSSRPAAPGSLVTVLGARVSSARAGDLNFPILGVTGTDSQIQVPFEATGANISLALEVATGRYRVGLPMLPVSPAIFVSPDGLPMLLDADSGLMLDASNAAHSGARIQVLATGLGKVRPDWPTGMAAPRENPPAVAAAVRAYLDRAPVEVTRAVLAPGYVGFYLVELQLPAIVNAGPAELYLSADGQSSNRVRIFLEP